MVTQELESRLVMLEDLIARMEREMALSPMGNLRIAMVGAKPTYYQVVDKNDTKGRYLTKKEGELISELAQKSYNAKLLRKARQEAGNIRHFLEHYEEGSLEGVYEGMNDCRKLLVSPWLISDSSFEERWLQEEYQGRGFRQGDTVHETLSGGRVRSKSELLIANGLLHAGIAYKYECPVVLNGITLYPDFTILKKKSRQVVYWEHFGMMDVEEYRNEFHYKLNQYTRNGIIPGGNLYMTFEEKNTPLNVHNIDGIIGHILESDK